MAERDSYMADVFQRLQRTEILLYKLPGMSRYADSRRRARFDEASEIISGTGLSKYSLGVVGRGTPIRQG